MLTVPRQDARSDSRAQHFWMRSWRRSERVAESECALKVSRSSRRPGASVRMSIMRSLGVLGVVFQGRIFQFGSLRGDRFLVCMKPDVLPPQGPKSAGLEREGAGEILTQLTRCSLPSAKS